LKRLKDVILSYLELSRMYMDRMMVYNYKGLELDDVDVPYLNPGEVLYLSMDGSSFSVLNYIYEYEIIKWIKAGGYGRVFLGRHVLKRDLYAAVKKIDISNLSTDEIYSISREALYLQSFTHRNIIKYINSYTYENHFYTVMDWAQGGELVNYLNEQKILSEQESKRIFRQIHDAVRYIHSRNVIHRDLKPNNILFLDTNRENVVIIDFGISGYNSGNVKETIKAGTTKFIPPELAAGLTYSSSPKFDIWAMGVILYSMLFGCFPFDGAKDSDIVNKIIKENHKFPNNITISKSAYNLINGLLEKNTSLRIELGDPLFQDWYNDTK
jgi:calcium-dependent protein kinase